MQWGGKSQYELNIYGLTLGCMLSAISKICFEIAVEVNYSYQMSNVSVWQLEDFKCLLQLHLALIVPLEKEGFVSLYNQTSILPSVTIQLQTFEILSGTLFAHMFMSLSHVNVSLINSACLLLHFWTYKQRGLFEKKMFDTSYQACVVYEVVSQTQIFLLCIFKLFLFLQPF